MNYCGLRSNAQNPLSFPCSFFKLCFAAYSRIPTPPFQRVQCLALDEEYPSLTVWRRFWLPRTALMDAALLYCAPCKKKIYPLGHKSSTIKPAGSNSIYLDYNCQQETIWMVYNAQGSSSSWKV